MASAHAVCQVDGYCGQMDSMSLPTSRMLWLDAYRGLAVVAMIWVHAANTFLTRDLQASAWFGQMTFYHGLIAPAFFWIGGLARGVRADAGKRPGWKTVRRLLGVMALGYALRFPLVPLVTGSMSPMDWAEMVKVDVLQTLAMTGLIMVAVERWVGSLWARQSWMLLLTVVAVLLTEPASGWATGWPWVDAWLNRNGGSVFCLFPWVAFGLAGWLCGSWSGRLGLGKMALIGSVMAWLLPHLYGASVQGVFFMQRLGWVVMAAWGMARLIDGLTRRAGRASGWLLLAGRESLVMYVAHLLMIHAVPLPALTLDKRLAYSLTLPQVLAVFLLLLVLSWALAWGNEWRKRRAKTMAKEALEAGKG
jgi:uncharacterized membrane protein